MSASNPVEFRVEEERRLRPMMKVLESKRNMLDTSTDKIGKTISTVRLRNHQLLFTPVNDTRRRGLV